MHGLALEEHLTFRLSRIQAKLNTQASKLLSCSAGITITQWRVLYLLNALGTSRAAELARLGVIDKGMLSRTIKQMLSSGLIRAERDDNDQRVQKLSITENGRVVFDQAQPVMQHRSNQLHSCMDETETATFMRILDRLETATNVE